MHKDEMWQVYHPNGLPKESEGWDSAVGNPEEVGSDTIVGVSVVFVFRVNDSGGVDLLWQKRGEKIDRYPGDYDISAGGHINLGESCIEGAIRECREEIGANITADDLYLVTMVPFNKNRLAWVFATDWTGREDSFSFDDGEVSEVKWVPFAEVDEFRERYAKAPLKNDKVTFGYLDGWFRAHGYI